MTAYQNIIRPSKKDQKTASDSLLAYEAMVRSLKSSNPIVDIEETRKQASDIVWSFRKKDEVKQEGKRILQKHVNNPNRKSKTK
jgi:hypothetical protein